MDKLFRLILTTILLLTGYCNTVMQTYLPASTIRTPPMRASLWQEMERVMEETQDTRSRMRLFYYITFHQEKGIDKILITYGPDAYTYTYDIGTAENPKIPIEIIDLTGIIAFVKYKDEFFIFNITNDIYKSFIEEAEIITDLTELRERFPVDEDPLIFDPLGYFYDIITPDSLLFLERTGI